MGNNNTKIPISHTWFDQLPTEIIFEIFDYLSYNDIIYTFLYLNQRLNKLLLQDERYLNYFEFPISNLIFWKNVFPIIGSKIESLKIIENNPSIPLKLFPNLKSILISSPYNLAEGQLVTILQSDQFKQLHSLKIKLNDLFFTPLFYSINQDHLLEKVFNNENSLHTFEYLSCIPSFSQKPFNYLQLNISLRSLTLDLREFWDLFTFIKYTPYLKYLNIKSNPPYGFNGQNQWSNINQIQLKQFILTFNDTMYGTNRFTARRIDFQQLINGITQFSSSLSYLSLNLIGCYITSSNDLPFNGIQLQRQFLQLMTHLKKFHLYAVLTQDLINIKNILSTFKNKFWFDHNWTVGMHEKYLYTLPFHFDKLYNFIDFNHIHSNILINNPQIWYNVKFIKFKEFNLDFLKLIKIQMPKLFAISIDYFNESEDIQNLHMSQNKTKNTDIILDHVTTVHFTCASLENEKQWLINALPNLKYLILSHTELPLLKSELAFKLNEKIQRLVIDGNSIVEQFGNESYIYFSNLQDLQLKFDWRFSSEIYDWYADMVIKLLKYFKNLKTLLISFNPFNSELTRSAPQIELEKILNKLDKNEIEKTYKMKYLREYVVFSKKKIISISFV